MSRFLGSNPVFDPDMLSRGNPLSALWRRRILFISVFVSVWAAVIATLFLIPSIYVTSGLVAIVQPESVFDVPVGEVLSAGDSSDVESQVYIAQSPAVMRRVLAMPEARAAAQKECETSSGLLGTSSADCKGFETAGADAVTYLQSHYSVSGSGRSRVMALSYTSRNPQTAQILANALVQAVLDNHRHEIAMARTAAIESISAQLDQLNADIVRQGETIQTFRNRNGVVSGAKSSVSAERLSSILQQLSGAEADRSRAVGLIEAARQGNLEDLSILAGEENSRGIADIKQQLAAAEAAAQSAAASLGPRHPELQNLQARANTLRSSLREELNRIAESAKKRLALADDVVADLKTQLDAAKTVAADATSAEVSIDDAVRALALDKQRFDTLSVQRNKMQADKLAALGRLRLVSKAEMPTRRYFPKTLPFVAGGFALALITAIVLAFVRDNLAADRRGEESDAEEADAAPALVGKSTAALPPVVRLPKLNLPDGDALSRAHAAVNDPKIRAALGKMLEGIVEQGPLPAQGPCTVVVLSAFAGAGRTMVSTMAAVYASQLGYEVLLVDADMRSAKAIPSARSQAAPGLYDILTQGRAPDTLVRHTRQGPGMLGAGSGGDGSAAALEDMSLASLVEGLDDYDFIFFDSPSLDRGMEAGLLARQATGALFCSKESDADSEETKALLRRLQGLGISLLGRVVIAQAVTSLLDAAVRDPDHHGQEMSE